MNQKGLESALGLEGIPEGMPASASVALTSATLRLRYAWLVAVCVCVSERGILDIDAD